LSTQEVTAPPRVVPTPLSLGSTIKSASDLRRGGEEGRGELPPVESRTALHPEEVAAQAIVAAPVQPSALPTSAAVAVKKHSENYSVISPAAATMKTVTLLHLTPRKHRAAALKAFNVTAMGGGVEGPQVERALDKLGHREPRGDWVGEILETSCGGRSFLDQDDFVVCAEGYRERFLEDLKLNIASSAGSRRALARLRGGEPSPEALASGDVDLEEFLNLRDLISDHKGLMPCEYRRILTAFQRFDEKKTGFLGPKAFTSALLWLGADTKYVRDAIARVDGKPYNEEQVLETMRFYFEREEARMYDRFKHLDVARRNLLGSGDLPRFLLELGHPAATPDLISEVMEAVGLSGRNELSFDEVTRLVMQLGEQRDFLLSELDEVAKAFAEFDVDGSGSMDASELEVVVRWMGYPVGFSAVRDVLDEYDLDGTGEIDRDMFVSFVSTFRDRDAASIRKTFALHDSGTGVMSAESLGKAFLFTLSEVPTQEQIVAAQEAVPAGGCIDLWYFMKCVSRVRAELLEKTRKNQCFHEAEVTRFKAMFAQYDPDNTGVIENANVAGLLTELFPAALENLDEHRKARNMLESADKDGDGKIDFDEFLKMMRMFRYGSTAEELRREKEAAETTSFTPTEVSEFRQVFNMFDNDRSGTLDMDELETILDNLGSDDGTGTPTGVLWKLVREVDAHGSKQLDFPAFLRFMQKVLEKDGAKGKAGR